jgi:regulatory protein
MRDRDVPDDELPAVEPSGDDVASTRRRRRPELTPSQRALGLLVRREHSRRELTRKLAARGVEADAARTAVERMTAEGWQDDARFAEQLVRSRAGNGYGPLRIRAELGTHGLDREAVAAALDTWDGDWSESARDLVRRRFPGGLDDPTARRKAADLLARRGFSGDQIRAATRFDPDED